MNLRLAQYKTPPDLADILLGQLVRSVRFTLRLAFLRDHIRRIIGICACEKMIGITALRVVAAMTYAQRTIQIEVGKQVCGQSMHCKVPPADGPLPVSTLSTAKLPFPAPALRNLNSLAQSLD